MLEADAALRTWRLNTPPDKPQKNADLLMTAEPLPDHRMEYLTYEGPVSNERGSVKRYDSGEYEILDETAERLSVRLSGQKVFGQYEFEIRSTA